MVHHPFSPVTVSFWDIHHFQPDPYHILYWILLVMYLVIYYMYVCKYHPVSIRYSQNIPSISTWPWQTTSICKCVFAHKGMMCMVIFWEIRAKLVDPCGPSKTPPARWGSLDFNKGANPPSFLPPSFTRCHHSCLLSALWSDASSRCCGARQRMPDRMSA